MRRRSWLQWGKEGEADTTRDGHTMQQAAAAKANPASDESSSPRFEARRGAKRQQGEDRQQKDKPIQMSMECICALSRSLQCAKRSSGGVILLLVGILFVRILFRSLIVPLRLVITLAVPLVYTYGLAVFTFPRAQIRLPRQCANQLSQGSLLAEPRDGFDDPGWVRFRLRFIFVITYSGI